MDISMGPFMQTKHPCVLIHYAINDEVGTVKLVEPSSNFLTDRSKAVFLLWMFSLFVIFVCLCKY